MNFAIEEQESHKDLGVQISSDGRFSCHIDELVKKVRKKVGWLCQSFMSRDIMFLRRVCISQIRPLIDYCAQVWAPMEGPDLDRVERLLSDFTKLCPSIRHLPYTDRLKAMKLSSTQRGLIGTEYCMSENIC